MDDHVWLASCGAAGNAYAIAYMIEGLATVVYPDYSPSPWKCVLITWAVIAVAILVNTCGSTMLPKFEAVMLMLHIFGYTAIVITLLRLAPKQDISVSFDNFIYAGGFPTQGLSLLVGSFGMQTSALQPYEMKRMEQDR